MKKKNPAAARNGSEVRRATDVPWSRADLKPLRLDLKKGERYLLHVQFDGVDFEAPPTEFWSDQTLTVEVIATGRGWITERTWTINYLTTNNAYEAVLHPTRPRGLGWEYEAPVARNSCSWRRRREVG